MRDPLAWRALRAVTIAGAGLALASGASAIRVGNAGAPAASAVQASAQQPAHVQVDESASLRQGTIGAVDERAARLQVQGIWLDIDPAKTKLLRNGARARLETLKVGEAIRFSVVPGTGAAPTLRLIYVP